jgi:hypothetical protein
MTSLLAMDREFSEWAASAPNHYLYRKVKVAGPNRAVFSDYYYNYPNVWVAATWNHYNCTRILVQNMIHEYLIRFRQDPEVYSREMEKFSPSDRERILASKSTIQELSSDICASVPYHFDYRDCQSSHASIDSPPMAASGTILLWPLFTAAASGLVPDEMCLWIVQRLRLIAEFMGIRQAAALAGVLQLKKDVHDWSAEENAMVEFVPSLYK